MIQITYCLKQKIGMIITASIFGLFGTVSAEEVNPIHLYDQSYERPLKGDLFPKSSGKSFSIGISVEERRPSTLGTWYSKSALEDYDFKFRDMTTAEKADTLDALKAAMDEFEVLQVVKETFEGTEETFERYIKKFMLKGDLKWKVPLIVVCIVFSVWYVFPINESINLGLDLQGGLHLVLQVEAEKVVENELIQVKEVLSRELKRRRIKFDSMQVKVLTKMRILTH